VEFVPKLVRNCRLFRNESPFREADECARIPRNGYSDCNARPTRGTQYKQRSCKPLCLLLFLSFLRSEELLVPGNALFVLKRISHVQARFLFPLLVLPPPSLPPPPFSLSLSLSLSLLHSVVTFTVYSRRFVRPALVLLHSLAYIALACFLRLVD